MAVFRITSFTKVATLAKKSIRYITHRRGRDGKSVTRQLFGREGGSDKTEAYEKIDKALREGGNKEVTTKELPGLNHLFQHCTSGSPAEYAEIEETCSPEVLAIMAEWIRSRSGLPVEAATEK